MPYNEHCHITGFSEDVDRIVLKNEFAKFGNIRKIFIEQSGKFAKVYFYEAHSCQKAANLFRNNSFGWKVVVNDETYQNSNNHYRKPENKDMYYDQDDVYVDPIVEEYVNIYGSPIEALMDGDNEIYVKLSDVQATGFSIFKKSEFRQLSEMQKRDIKIREFNLHMLQEAGNYLLQHSLAIVDQEQILDTIAKCKNRLFNSENGKDNCYRTDSRDENRDKFQSRGRSKSSSRNSNSSFGQSNFSNPVRPPKNFPNNFVPSHSHKSTAQSNNRNHRQPERHNDGFTRSEWSGHRQNSRQTNKEESWDTNQPQHRNANFSKPGNKLGQENSRYFDSQSQTSSASSKKPSVLKMLEAVDQIPKTDFEIDQIYEVKISHVEEDKANICWVQEVDAEKKLEDLLLLLDDASAENGAVDDVQRGQLAMAEFDEVWCRCRVINLNPLNVFFLDYGNRADVRTVKKLPENCRKIPTIANRIVVNRNDVELVNEMELGIKIRQKYDDGTYLIDLDKSQGRRQEATTARVKKEETSSPSEEAARAVKEKENEKEKEKWYFDVPEPMGVIKNGDRVMLIGLEGNKFVVKTKEGAQKSKEILEYIKFLNKSDLLLSQVKEGQLVLCSMDGLPNLCRAVVLNRESPIIAEVKYLDYAGNDRLSVKSLRNVDGKLATEPLTRLLTPEMEVIGSLGERSIDFINELLEKKEKVKVIITEDEDFDLQMSDGVLLSQRLLEMERPKEVVQEMPKLIPVTNNAKEVEETAPKPVEVAPKVADSPEPRTNGESETISYNDMPYVKADVGETTDYICYTITDLTDITLLSMTDESVSYMEKISDLDIKDATPFEPEVMDMCLVSYKTVDEEEPSWYRAVVLDKEVSGYELSLVDYGGQIVAPSEDIRKFPAHLKDIPILGIMCSIANIPNNAKTLKRVKEMIAEGEEVTVVVKEFVEDELKYLIEIPELREKLKKEGLC